MDHRQEELSRYRIQEAKNSLKVAEHCLKEGLYKDSINRSYYVAFYAIKAVLALGTIDFKRHKDVVAYFNKEYVATNVFPRELGKRLGMLKQLREKSDYDDFYIATREEAEEQIQTAKELVSRVEEYVQARWRKESEKTVQNAEYLDMIDRGIDQLSAGNGQEHELNETD